MGADNERLDRLRIRIAWVVTGVWLLCFPIVAVFKDFPITWAQPPMIALMGWLFASPLIRRNGNEGDQ